MSMKIRTISAAAAFAAVGSIALLAQSGSASAAKSFQSCDGSSRRSVIECCETLVRKDGLSNWFLRQGKSCRAASVVCSYKKTSTALAVAPVKVCKLVFSPIEGGGGGKKTGGGNPGGGGQQGGGRTAGKGP